MISGTGLGNLVIVLPKYHCVPTPRLGHPSVEFVFAVFAFVAGGLWWLVRVLWYWVVFSLRHLRGNPSGV